MGATCSEQETCQRRIESDSIARLAPYRFQPGQSGNPGGKPKVDLAAKIARAIFENDGPAIYAAYSKMLRKGSAYCFQVLSDRAFGKQKERHKVEVGPYREMTDDELRQRIAQLQRSKYRPKYSSSRVIRRLPNWL